MPPTPRGVTQADWPSAFPVDVRPVISAIVGGAPFARSLAPLPTSRTGVVFPLVSEVSEPAWGVELSAIPTIDLESDEYAAAVSRLSGNILISQESIDDTEYPVTEQVTQVIQDKLEQARPGLHRRRGAAPGPDRGLGRGRRSVRRGPGAGGGRGEGRDRHQRGARRPPSR